MNKLLERQFAEDSLLYARAARRTKANPWWDKETFIIVFLCFAAAAELCWMFL